MKRPGRDHPELRLSKPSPALERKLHNSAGRTRPVFANKDFVIVVNSKKPVTATERCYQPTYSPTGSNLRLL